MTLEEIKAAVDSGKTVYWKIPSYTIEKWGKDSYQIVHTNGHAIGLTWMDGVTMNGKEEDFHIGD